jgi:heme/copper-type cytochrome/quinol oxidase subunit 2
MAVLLVDRRGFKEVGNLIPNRKRMRRRGAASAPAIRMARVLLPRSRKPVSLFISLAGVLLAFALNASPAMALSLNPDAASPGIEDGNTLHWILFVVILVVIVAVNLAILRAARPRTRAVSPKQGRNVSQVKLAVGLSVFALALFVVATIFSDKSREIPAVNAEPVAGQVKGEPLQIRATGSQWLWRFDYPNASFSYRRLVVPAGVTVQLDLESTDVVHGWNLPELTGKAQAIPGKTNSIYFRADEPGIYENRSSMLSGQGYDTMGIEVHVVPPAEYEAAIDLLRKEIQFAQDKVEAEFELERKKSEISEMQAEKTENQIQNNQIESAASE